MIFILKAILKGLRRISGNLFIDSSHKIMYSFYLIILIRQYIHDTAKTNKRTSIIRTYPDFVAYISKNGIPSIISFDHDLGLNVDSTEAESGYDAVKYIMNLIIEQEHRVLPQVLRHS